jgi:universal stress protein A
MSDYKHILLAVDFSDYNQKIALKAQRLATFYQAKLSLLHVVDSASFIHLNYDLELPDTNLNDLLIKSSKKKLEQLTKDLQLRCQQKWVVVGYSHEEIIRVAKENSVDLIVIGSHARHGLRLLLGSTANAVLHHSNCDVLAVRLKHD